MEVLSKVIQHPAPSKLAYPNIWERIHGSKAPPIMYGITAARTLMPTISAPERSHCLWVNVVFQRPMINREENVMMEEVKKLFSGEEIGKNGIMGIRSE
ncbi:MAG: hypothetical protein NWF14_05230, partial [Candidatus Bathyarchaeota archaeon]|nr:hypothetical protein [Candidatus Bathyarchaeota archaeon]